MKEVTYGLFKITGDRAEDAAQYLEEQESLRYARANGNLPYYEEDEHIAAAEDRKLAQEKFGVEIKGIWE